MPSAGRLAYTAPTGKKAQASRHRGQSAAHADQTIRSIGPKSCRRAPHNTRIRKSPTQPWGEQARILHPWSSKTSWQRTLRRWKSLPSPSHGQPPYRAYTIRQSIYEINFFSRGDASNAIDAVYRRASRADNTLRRWCAFPAASKGGEEGSAYVKTVTFVSRAANENPQSLSRFRQRTAHRQ